MPEEAWIIGRMLDDGTRQVHTNEDGTVKAFHSESEAKDFIAAELQDQGDVFAFSVELAEVILMPTAGHA